MKKITILILLFANIIGVFAQQINDSMIETWFGSGSNKAYLIIDFNDGTANESLIWGYRFNDSDAPTMYDMLESLAQQESCFSFDASPTFLDLIFFNDKGDDSGTDWWKTWSGSSYENLGMNAGLASRITNENIYAFSYGFMCGAICDSPPSFPIAALSCNSLSINNIKENDVTVYPNPAQNIINLQINPDTYIKDIIVFDSNGKILNVDFINNTLLIDRLTSGIYFIKINTDKGSLTKKIIKK